MAIIAKAMTILTVIPCSSMMLSNVGYKSVFQKLSTLQVVMIIMTNAAPVLASIRCYVKASRLKLDSNKV